ACKSTARPHRRLANVRGGDDGAARHFLLRLGDYSTRCGAPHWGERGQPYLPPPRPPIPPSAKASQTKPARTCSSAPSCFRRSARTSAASHRLIFGRSVEFSR